MCVCVSGGSVATAVDHSEMNGVGGSSYINTNLSFADTHVYPGLALRYVMYMYLCIIVCN